MPSKWHRGKRKEHTDYLFLAETYSSGELGTSWQEASTLKIMVLLSQGWDVGPEKQMSTDGM